MTLTEKIVDQGLELAVTAYIEGFLNALNYTNFSVEHKAKLLMESLIQKFDNKIYRDALAATLIRLKIN